MHKTLHESTSEFSLKPGGKSNSVLTAVEQRV
jgi:hypothetical protein